MRHILELGVVIVAWYGFGPLGLVIVLPLIAVFIASTEGNT